MLDNRRSGRSPTRLRGRISYNNGLWGEECLVRDVSRGGALLKVTDPRTLPDRFMLTIEKLDADRPVYVRWRAHDALGVAFETGAPAEVIDLVAVRSRLTRKGLGRRV